MRSASNASVVSGIMVDAYSAAHFVTTSFARMTSLNTKPLVKFWRLRATNVSRVIDLDNTHVFVVKFATVRTTFVVRVSNMRRIRPFLVPSVTLKQVKQRTSACQVSSSSLVFVDVICIYKQP